MRTPCAFLAAFLFMVAVAVAGAQSDAQLDVRLRLAYPKSSKRHSLPSAVLWLKPMEKTAPAPFRPEHEYRLLQKNRAFRPHLSVIPVGSVVSFPNADPFFHNVFSLFDGKRFDLGLYEAGSSRSVTFSREGVSYIFCNIHPEMSAVILTLSTRLYAKADADGVFEIARVPAGDYQLHIWIEGAPQPELDRMTRVVHLAPGSADLGEVKVPFVPLKIESHTNMYGQPYDRDAKPTY